MIFNDELLKGYAKIFITYVTWIGLKCGIEEKEGIPSE